MELSSEIVAVKQVVDSVGEDRTLVFDLHRHGSIAHALACIGEVGVDLHLDRQIQDFVVQLPVRVDHGFLS